MALWVNIQPVITPANPSTTKVVTVPIKTLIERDLVERIVKALPKGKFNANKDDQPGPSKTPNALGINAELTLEATSAGPKWTTDCKLNMNFESITTPNIKHGLLLAGKKMGAVTQSRGDAMRAIPAGVSEAFDNIVDMMVKEVLRHPSFIVYAKKMGVPL